MVGFWSRSSQTLILRRIGCLYSFITVFVTVFATVIALTKDLADIEGDRQYGIQTFATMLGTQRLLLLCASPPPPAASSDFRPALPSFVSPQVAISFVLCDLINQPRMLSNIYTTL